MVLPCDSERLAASLREADLALSLHAIAHPSGPIRLRVHELHLGCVQGRLLLDSAALRVLLTSPEVLEAQVHPLNDDLVLVLDDPHDATLIALVRSGDHHDEIV